jgi:2-(1,2-epoxy-1,2-dihydrophenyl)acetyl-CoA isomerase
LPQRVGLARAVALAMTGDKLSAERACEWGLVWQCVEDAELMPAASALAAKLSLMPTRALVATRKLMQQAQSVDLLAQAATECDVQAELAGSRDYAEGVAAFLAKRAPKFTGQ